MVIPQSSPEGVTMRKAGFITLLLVAGLALAGEAAREGSITADVAPGVSASFKHRIEIERETWPSVLSETRAGRAALRLEEKGGFRLHVRIRENPDDYIVCIVYVDERGELLLDENTRFVFTFDDREVSSTEILLTDTITETRVFSTLETPVLLTHEAPRYAKSRSGGYLTAVRFSRGELPAGAGWVPESFELRGGDIDESEYGQTGPDSLRNSLLSDRFAGS